MEYLNSLEAAAQCGMTLAYHAQQAPDRLAVASQFGDRSFSQLNARANQVVRRLREAGLGTDDSVAMLLVNRPEFLEVLFACQRGGFRVTPINWHLTGDNASYIVGNCEAKAFIADVRCAEPAQLALQDHAGQLHIALAVGGSVEGFAESCPTSQQHLLPPTYSLLLGLFLQHNPPVAWLLIQLHELLPCQATLEMKEKSTD